MWASMMLESRHSSPDKDEAELLVLGLVVLGSKTGQVGTLPVGKPANTS